MVQIHGHRGFRGRYPENSIKGFIEAKRLGVNAIELDLILTGDLQLIVNHDPWLRAGCYMINKTGEVPDQDINLFNKSFEAIKQYALGTKRDLNFPEQIPSPHRIPSFKEVIEHVDLQDVFWNIEIKSDEKRYGQYQAFPKEYAELVNQYILENSLSTSCMVQSFDSNFLNELEKLIPTYPLGLLVENELSLSQNLERLNFKPDFYNLNDVLVTKDLINQIHYKGIQCCVWTVNDKSRASKLITWGVDGLITDYPDELLK